MKRALIAIVTSVAAVGALLLPAGSLATLTELGATPTSTTAPAMPPSCPTNPCLAVSRTTGFQAKVGTVRAPLTAPRAGKIVAWTIQLGKPTAKQITFFNTNEGGASSAGIAILRPGPRLNYRLIDQSPVVPLQPYFGATAQFPLDRSLTVAKGDVVALTVPTWAPGLALGYANTTSWRASRPRAKCSDTTTQTAQTGVGSTIQYYCLYRTARLSYTATLISTP
jgi:hypothetical protein